MYFDWLSDWKRGYKTYRIIEISTWIRVRGSHDFF